MAKLEEMVERTLGILHGATGELEPYGTLQSAIDANDMSFTINSGEEFDSGVSEIGTEIVIIQTVENGVASGVLRGQWGTKATVHPAGTGVVNNPKFRRQELIDAINETILNVGPDLVAVKSTEFTGSATKDQFDLPADAINVIDVQWLPSGPSGAWRVSKNWRFDLTGGSNSSTGKTVTIRDKGPSQKVQVVYIAKPKKLNIGDDFTASGLPEYAEEVVRMGAQWRMVNGVPAGLATANPGNQGVRQDGSSNDGGVTLSKLYNAVYTTLLSSASRQQREELPVRFHGIS